MKDDAKEIEWVSLNYFNDTTYYEIVIKLCKLFAFGKWIICFIRGYFWESIYLIDLKRNWRFLFRYFF